MKVWGLSQRDRERHSQLEDPVMKHLLLPSVASSCWKWWICGVAFIAVPDPLYLYEVTRLELMGQLRHGEGHRVSLMNSSLDLLQGL